MKILFILYGDFNTNTAGPVMLFARELHERGHQCAIAVPNNIESVFSYKHSFFSPFLYEDILSREGCIFNDNERADVLHACTPRINVFDFLKKYLCLYPTPMLLYLEDNENWITKKFLDIENDDDLGLTHREIHEKLPASLSSPFDLSFNTALADLVVTIQDKLRSEVPSIVPAVTIPWGVDTDFFSPSIVPSENLKNNLNLSDGTKILVYHGGLNGFTRSAMMDLCRAVEIINNAGVACKLIRTGNNSINFLNELNEGSHKFIIDLGLIDRNCLPEILSLADLFVQPGRIDAFEDLRLPSKIPEFFSMGKPVVIPNVNIASSLRDGIDACILRDGTPKEIADTCLELFKNKRKSESLSKRSRELAFEMFGLKNQTIKLENAYLQAISNFDKDISVQSWTCALTSSIDEGAILKVRLIGNKRPHMLSKCVDQLVRWNSNALLRIKSIEQRIDNQNVRDRETACLKAESLNYFPIKFCQSMLKKIIRFGRRVLR